MKKKILLKMITIILFLFIILGLIFIIKKLIPGYKNEEIMDMTNLVINSSNVTDYLKDNNTKVYVKDEVIYLSINDLRNFFDKYIYIDEQYGKIISTYNSNIVILDINTGKVNLNTEEFKTRFLPFEVDGIIYLPFSELQKAYDANCTYITDTNTVIIDTEDKDKTLAVIEQNTKLKSRKRNLSRTIYELKENEEIMIIEEYDKWSKVRTNKGKIGFVLTSKIGEKREIKSLLNTQNNKNKKINMFWDYFYSEESIPDRSGQEFEGINVVSPSFFILDNNGDIKTNIGIKGEKYIEWAHSNKYEVWAMFSNDSQKELTSKILNNYEKRQKLILEIMNLVKKYKLDGINVDFENMYMDDKDVFSRFIIELKPRMKAIGKEITVDVTAPDGAEDWSMCYDRNVLGDVSDYIIFMAYDQYGEASLKPGTTSGYGWVKTNLNKFIETEEIEPQKIILGLPFYSRIWITKDNELIESKVVSMKNIYKNIPSNVEIIWDDITRQNYAKYEENGYNKEIWIEDITSYKEKLTLIQIYELGGVSNWCKDMEVPEIWKIIKENLS